MINAGSIINNKGTYANGILQCSVSVNFPLSLPNGNRQNINENQLTNNDYVIDSDGNVWKVNTVVFNSSTQSFDCTLSIQNSNSKMITNSSTIDKCAVVTSNSNGLLAPYYHDSYISTSAFRAAMAHNMNIYTAKISGSQLARFDFTENLNSDDNNYTLTHFGSSFDYVNNLGCSNQDNIGVNIINATGFEFDEFRTLFQNNVNFSIEIELKLHRSNSYESIILFESGTGENIKYSRLYLYDQNIHIVDDDNEQVYTTTRINTTILSNLQNYIIKFEKNNNKVTIYIDSIKEIELECKTNIFENVEKLYFFNTKFDTSYGRVFSGQVCSITINQLFPANELIHFYFLNSLLSDSKVSDELQIGRPLLKYEQIPSKSTTCLRLDSGSNLMLSNFDELLPDQTNFIIELNMALDGYLQLYHQYFSYVSYQSTENTQINLLLRQYYDSLAIYHNDSYDNNKTATTVKFLTLDSEFYIAKPIDLNKFTKITIAKTDNIINLYINGKRVPFTNVKYALYPTPSEVTYDYIYFNDVIKHLFLFDITFAYDTTFILIDQIKIYSGTLTTNTLIADFQFDNTLASTTDENLLLTLNRYNYPLSNKLPYISAKPVYENYGHNNVDNTKQTMLNLLNADVFFAPSMINPSLINSLIPDKSNFSIEIDINPNQFSNNLISFMSDNIVRFEIYYARTGNTNEFVLPNGRKLNVVHNYADPFTLAIIKKNDQLFFKLNGVLVNIFDGTTDLGQFIIDVFDFNCIRFNRGASMWDSRNYLRDVKFYADELITLTGHFELNNTLSCSINPLNTISYTVTNVSEYPDIPQFVVKENQAKNILQIPTHESLVLNNVNTLIPDTSNLMIEFNISGSSSYFELASNCFNFAYLIYPLFGFSGNTELVLYSQKYNGYALVYFIDPDSLRYDTICILSDPNRYYNIKFMKRGNIITVLVDDTPIHFAKNGISGTAVDLGIEYDMTGDTVFETFFNNLTTLNFFTAQHYYYGELFGSRIDFIKLYSGVNNNLVASFDFNNSLTCTINPNTSLINVPRTVEEEEESEYLTFENGVYGLRIPINVKNYYISDFSSKINNIKKYTIKLDCTLDVNACYIEHCPIHTTNVLKFGSGSTSIRVTFINGKFYLESSLIDQEDILYNQTAYSPTDWIDYDDECKTLWCNFKFIREDTILTLYTSKVLSTKGTEITSDGFQKQFEYDLKNIELDDSILYILDSIYDLYSRTNKYIYDFQVLSGVHV